MLTYLYAPAFTRRLAGSQAVLPMSAFPEFRVWAARGRMGIQVALNHRTLYRYEKAISLGPQVIQLRPALHCRTPILSYSLEVTPSEHVLRG